MKKMSLLLMFLTVLVVMPSAFAQSSINTSNTYCPTNGGGLNGYTTIIWSVSSGIPDNVAVFVNDNGGAYTLMAAARSGSQYCSWIVVGHTYYWELADGLDSSIDVPTDLGGSGSGAAINATFVDCVAP